MLLNARNPPSNGIKLISVIKYGTYNQGLAAGDGMLIMI